MCLHELNAAETCPPGLCDETTFCIATDKLTASPLGGATLK